MAVNECVHRSGPTIQSDLRGGPCKPCLCDAGGIPQEPSSRALFGASQGRVVTWIQGPPNDGTSTRTSARQKTLQLLNLGPKGLGLDNRRPQSIFGASGNLCTYRCVYIETALQKIQDGVLGFCCRAETARNRPPKTRRGPNKPHRTPQNSAGLFKRRKRDRGRVSVLCKQVTLSPEVPLWVCVYKPRRHSGRPNPTATTEISRTRVIHPGCTTTTTCDRRAGASRLTGPDPVQAGWTEQPGRRQLCLPPLARLRQPPRP